MARVLSSLEKNDGNPHFPSAKRKVLGPTEIWTRIAGFRVQSANHYTMGPACVWMRQVCCFNPLTLKNFLSEKRRARPGFEPGTSRTLSENHTPRPTSQAEGWSWHFENTLEPGCEKGWPTSFMEQNKDMFPAGIEPATLSVWRTRDNHYTKETLVLFDEQSLPTKCFFPYLFLTVAAWRNG